MTLTPYAFWRRQHANITAPGTISTGGGERPEYLFLVHDRRGTSGVGSWRRCLVRLTNHPIVANLLLPPIPFVLLYRMPFEEAEDGGASDAGSI